jgi:LDH2 family malate/lactate/ureidoglycolate dehydrogenase
MPIYLEEMWRALGSEMVKASGVSNKEVKTIVDVLITGSLRGIDSHGVRALPTFTEWKGKCDMKLVKDASAIAILDANQTFGPVSAKRAMEIAIEKAEKHGIGCCSVMNGEWIVNLFYYSMIAVEKDMIGTVYAREGPVCVPWGGLTPIMGTNPMSMGIPAGDAYPIVLDFATTMVAQGHVKTLLLEGKPLPEGWLIDRKGNPIKDYTLSLDELDKFWERGGSLLPFGTYKGYGINLAIDILGGALNLTGTGPRAVGQGVLMTAIDVGSFVEVEEFKKEVDRLVNDVKSSPLMPGFEEILLPGEREHRTMEKRRKEGIPVDEISWQEILNTCHRLGIEAERIMQ